MKPAPADATTTMAAVNVLFIIDSDKTILDSHMLKGKPKEVAHTGFARKKLSSAPSFAPSRNGRAIESLEKVLFRVGQVMLYALKGLSSKRNVFLTRALSPSESASAGTPS